MAYKSLESTKAEYLKLGIELAKRIQQLIVEQGISFVEKQEVKPYRSFRYIMMTKNNTREQRFFSHPLSLQKLGTFICQVYQAQGKKDLPILIANTDKEKGRTNVLGMKRQTEEFSIKK